MARAWEVEGLRAGVRFRTAAGRVILTRWRELMSHAPGVRAGADPRALKDMRISSRRLRVAMDAFADVFPAAAFRRHLRVVKEIADTLGAARDLDVAVAGLRRRAAELERVAHPGVEGLVARLEERRAGEEPVIVALLERLDAEGFGPAFERWVRKHTGVDPERLAPGPPA